MKFNVYRELPPLLIMLIPFAYLAFIWNSLPAEVPVHWSINGEINRWGSKNELWILPFLLPFLVYVIFIIMPFIDPKRQIESMGPKFHNLKLIMVLSMSLLAVVILYATQQQELSETLLFAALGFMFTALGNFFKTIRPNYFIGIRTPWTLENETVWRKTHRMSGKLWFAGGLLIILSSLTLAPQTAMIFFFSMVALLTLIPLVYSYRLYHRLK
ncbi:MAG: SdpI family protein [Owenweeksia sp.]